VGDDGIGNPKLMTWWTKVALCWALFTLGHVLSIAMRIHLVVRSPKNGVNSWMQYWNIRWSEIMIRIYAAQALCILWLASDGQALRQLLAELEERVPIFPVAPGIAMVLALGIDKFLDFLAERDPKYGKALPPPIEGKTK
jgi:hypothetical protein